MIRAALSSLSCLLAFGAALRAEEGMWTFDNLPVKQIREKYGVPVDEALVHRLKMATVRFPGGTGAFVSRDGLVITNHHVARGAIVQLSSRERDLDRDGFAALTREQELKVPGYELMLLVGTEDITARVKAAGQGKPEQEAAKARKDAQEALRAAAEKATGLSCEAVNLYRGGEYWIYRYRKFRDVRLVAAPEAQVANFGGDEDNYTYPRFNLDFTLMRVYGEDGKPYHPEAWFPFATEPLKAGDLTFVTGHPGSTFRQQTAAQMAFARDFLLPWQIRSAERRKKSLLAFATAGGEAKRLAANAIYGLDNGRKRNQGRLNGLLSPAAFAKVEQAEKALRQAVLRDPELNARAGGSWDRIAQAVEREKALLKESQLIDSRYSDLLGQALSLVRFHGELARPVQERLPDFQDEKAVRRRIETPRPIQKNLDEARFAEGLQEVLDELGSQHPFVKALLEGRSPAEVARTAMAGTRLHELAARKALLEGGAPAVQASQDPMLVLARRIDGHLRAIRKQMETDVNNVVNEHAGRIAEARFKLYGKSQYPDATFTLRVTFGPVATYVNGCGTKAQPFTTLGGLYDRHDGWGGNAAGAEDGLWALPQRWLDRKDRLALATPYNFINAVDTVGGNSGSPVLNAKGELVGLNFDSVYEGQGGYYVYDSANKRSIAVDARIILEALRKVYDAGPIVEELMGK